MQTSHTRPGNTGSNPPARAGDSATWITARAEDLLGELQTQGLTQNDETETLLDEMIGRFDQLDEEQQADLLAAASLLDPDRAREIARRVSHDGELRLTVDDRQMAVRLDITPPKGTGTPVAFTQVIEELRRLGTRAPIDQQAIRNALQRVAEAKEPIAGICVCQGTPPTPGGDARLELLAGLGDPGVTSETEGRPSSRPKVRILMVKVGEAVARVVPPSPGKVGKDVFGQPIAPPPSREVVVRPGENVTYREDQGLFVADIDGMPELQNDVLSVRRAYVVPGDVDITTGSVTFPGSVTVEGSVRDGFHVRAGDDIRIQGTVEAVEVVSERGSVLVRGGINGRSRGIVMAAEDIEARFAENACLYAGKSIRLSASVRSQLFAGDAIEIRQGRGVALAGSLCARHRVDVTVLGSSANVDTEVVLGMSPDEQRALRDLDRSIASSRQAEEKLVETLKSFESKGPPDQLKKAEGILYGRLKVALLVTRHKLRQCVDDRQRRLEGVCLSREGVARIAKQLMPGVRIRIGDKTLKVDREEAASVIRYSPETDTIECTGSS